METILIAYVTPSQDKSRRDQFFNFQPQESRQNFILAKPAPYKGIVYKMGTNEPINPCQKPLMQLMDYLITHFSRPGNWVLDLCAGTGTICPTFLLLLTWILSAFFFLSISGSTSISALDNGRSCIAVEINKSFCESILSRILAHLNQDDEQDTMEVEDPSEKPSEDNGMICFFCFWCDH